MVGAEAGDETAEAGECDGLARSAIRSPGHTTAHEQPSIS